MRRRWRSMKASSALGESPHYGVGYFQDRHAHEPLLAISCSRVILVERCTIECDRVSDRDRRARSPFRLHSSYMNTSFISRAKIALDNLSKTNQDRRGNREAKVRLCLSRDISGLLHVGLS